MVKRVWGMMKDIGTFVAPRQNVKQSCPRSKTEPPCFCAAAQQGVTCALQEPEVPGHLFNSPTGMVLNSSPARWRLRKRHPLLSLKTFLGPTW